MIPNLALAHLTPLPASLSIWTLVAVRANENEHLYKVLLVLCVVMKLLTILLTRGRMNRNINHSSMNFRMIRLIHSRSNAVRKQLSPRWTVNGTRMSIRPL